jgi:hypothetical protein
MDDLKHPMPLGYIHGVPRRCQRCPLAGVGCSSGRGARRKQLAIPELVNRPGHGAVSADGYL